MKVLFLSGSINQGGAEFQILALARLFKQEGNDVEVLALTDYSFYKPFLEASKIKYSHLLNSQSRAKRIWLTSRKMREVRPDVVVAYLRAVGQVAILARFLSLRDFKIVIGERTSLTIQGYDQYYFNLMRFADVLTVNSISKYNYILDQYPFLKGKTYFLPNILDLNVFQPTTPENRLSVNISFIGRISPEKNVLKLIQAFKVVWIRYPMLTLNLFGDVRNSQYLKDVRKEIESDLEVKSNIVLHGKRENMLDVYRETDLLCLISEFEGFSNVISEAQCCGIPVVASNIEENRYLITDGLNGFLVDYSRVQDIAEGIQRYLELSAEAKVEMRENSRRKAEAVFDNKKIYSEYLKIINLSSL